MKEVKLQINGTIYKSKLFKTRDTADKFIAKNNDHKIVYYRAGEYYVAEI